MVTTVAASARLETEGRFERARLNHRLETGTAAAVFPLERRAAPGDGVRIGCGCDANGDHLLAGDQGDFSGSLACGLVPVAALAANRSDVDLVVVDDHPDPRAPFRAVEPDRLHVDLATPVEQIESLAIEGRIA